MDKAPLLWINQNKRFFYLGYGHFAVLQMFYNMGFGDKPIPYKNLWLSDIFNNNQVF